MTLLCKNNALYVKACVIQNNVADTHGDILNSEDIKKIFTTFNNQSNFEIYHNEIPLTEISLLENYISTNEEIIAGVSIPEGSWNVVIRVDNPEIKHKLLNNDFGGISLNNRVKTECTTGLSGSIRYSDLKDAECVIPVLISFVEEPANKVGLHIMDYSVYITKSKNGEKMSLLEELKALISKAEKEQKQESEPADVIEKDAETEGSTAEEDGGEPVEVVKDADEGSDEKKDEEEPTIEKEDEEIDEPKSMDISDVVSEIENIKAEISDIKQRIGELEPVPNPIDEEITANDVVNEPIITKSSKIEVVEESQSTQNFYEMTNRDKITGKKIREKNKVL